MTSPTSLRELIPKCTACPVRTEAIQPVPFEGPETAQIMFIGRNPGGTEDKLGRPFVGPGGILLDEWIIRAGLVREQVLITNLLKCYTTHDRPPVQSEIDICTGLWLHNELQEIQPKIIIPLGKQAMHYFVPGISVTPYQGIWYLMRHRTLFYLSHPGYVLRGGFSRDLWLGFADQFKQESPEYL